MSNHKSKLITDSKTLVNDSLQGLAYLNPHLELDQANRIISLKEPNPTRCHLLCGGGSGHEPSHAGFVGQGMLSVAVCGNIFASPSSQQVTHGLRTIKDTKGILMVVKNYTGDVINFGIAKERWIAQNNVEKLKMVIVGDDVSVGKEQGKVVGRRGLASTILVYKIAGALAAQGASLSHLHALAQFVADHSGTIGVGLDYVQIPGISRDYSFLGPDEIEIGMGIHNEPGYKRQKSTDLNQLISELLVTLTSTSDKDRSFIPFRSLNSSSKNEVLDDVILLINNLGSISELEMGAIVKATGLWLIQKGFVVRRAIVGKLMTSLDMPGFSISLFLLPRKNEDVKIEVVGDSPLIISADVLLDLFDAPTSCSAWNSAYSSQPNFDALQPQPLQVKPENSKSQQTYSQITSDKDDVGTLTVGIPDTFVSAIKAACQSLIAAEPEITKYDTMVGDGDCGLTLKSGAEGLLQAISAGKIQGRDIIADLLQISEVVDREMGGTSGGFYSIFFNSLAVGVSKNKTSSVIGASTWAKAVDHALNTLLKYTRARPPSRTMIDPLSAFVLTFSLTPDEFDKAIEEAKAAAEATMYLEAQAGRASYVNKEKVKNSEVPDAGAWGVWKILEGIGRVTHPKADIS
ncbi:hypothetical protein O181_025923 [Austropuccinia psidii MF-1]|uniref:Dihydroxyacetone kinase n=1 Tax=Austropuccinia psidii MF-1 TaxID=1389203 RepID=A0A9Q3CNT6_9BASI|nr:hypothetical protein [Austropuccinia psidii MF-1]